MPDEPDVLGSGEEPDGLLSRVPDPVIRVVVLTSAAVVTLVLLTQSGLLSAAPPRGVESPTEPGERLVAMVDGHLLLEGQDDWTDGPDLPAELQPSADLVPVLMQSGRSQLVGVAGRTLFRVAPDGSADVTPIGRAASVVAASPQPGRVLVERPGGKVVDVDVMTGAVSDPTPFPGHEPRFGWRPVGVLTAAGTSASLLMARDSVSGGTELALAGPSRPVRVGSQPAMRALRTVRRVLAVWEDSVLAAGAGCPGPECRVEVMTVTRDDVLTRDVAPPTDWQVRVGSIGGRSRSGLLLVERPDQQVQALARPVPGGDATLLVGASEGVDVEAGLVDGLSSVSYVVVRDEHGAEHLRSWSPGDPARLRPARRPALPVTARLVCVCG